MENEKSTEERTPVQVDEQPIRIQVAGCDVQKDGVCMTPPEDYPLLKDDVCSHRSVKLVTSCQKMTLSTEFKPIPFNTFVRIKIKAIVKHHQIDNLISRIFGNYTPFAYQINPEPGKDAPIQFTDYLDMASPNPKIECQDLILLCGSGEVIIECQRIKEANN